MKNNYVHMICYMYTSKEQYIQGSVLHRVHDETRILNLKNNTKSVRIMCTCTRERVLKFVHYTVVSYNCYIQVLSFANRRICTRREKHNHPTPKPLSLFLFPPFLCFYNLLLSILRRISLYISPFNILVRAPLGPRLKASVLSIFNMSINYQRVPLLFSWTSISV